MEVETRDRRLPNLGGASSEGGEPGCGAPASHRLVKDWALEARNRGVGGLRVLPASPPWQA